MQGEESASEFWLNVSRRHDSKLIFLSWKGRWERPPPSLAKYLFLPKSTLTEGRNLLFRTAVELDKQRGWNVEYFIFSDEDMDSMYVHNKTEKRFLVDTLHADWRAYPRAASVIHRLLLTYRPVRAGANGHLGKYGSMPTSGQCKNMPISDEAFEAFHRSAVELLLPYDGMFDDFNWWMPAIMLNTKVEVFFKPYAVIFEQILWCVQGQNKHGDYNRKGQVGDKMLTAVWKYMANCLPKGAAEWKKVYPTPKSLLQAAWNIREIGDEPCRIMPVDVDYAKMKEVARLREHWMAGPDKACGSQFTRNLTLD